jgi:hypothetical protein
MLLDSGRQSTVYDYDQLNLYTTDRECSTVNMTMHYPMLNYNDITYREVGYEYPTFIFEYEAIQVLVDRVLSI